MYVHVNGCTLCGFYTNDMAYSGALSWPDMFTESDADCGTKEWCAIIAKVTGSFSCAKESSAEPITGHSSHLNLLLLDLIYPILKHFTLSETGHQSNQRPLVIAWSRFIKDVHTWVEVLHCTHSTYIPSWKVKVTIKINNKNNNKKSNTYSMVNEFSFGYVHAICINNKFKCICLTNFSHFSVCCQFPSTIHTTATNQRGIIPIKAFNPPSVIYKGFMKLYNMFTQKDNS